MSELPKLQIAYHEAGHAVTAIVLNLKIVTVTIERGEDSQGTCKVFGVMAYRYTNLRERKSIARDYILNSYSGFEAEKMFNPEADPGFSADDFEDAEDTSKTFAILPRKCFVGDEKHLAYLERFKIGARKLLRKSWPSVKAVAEAPMEGKTLTHEEVEQIIRETQPDLLEA